MEYRKIGNSDLSASVIGFGCWGLAGGAMWGAQEEAESIRALHAAVENGITFFDTAEGYGDGYSEEVVGKGLADRREKVIIASKVSPQNLAPADLRSACEASLRRLSMDTIDLYQIHWPTPPGDPDGVTETLQKLKNEGKIRYAGVSNFGPVDLEPYAPGLFVSNQLPYSLLFRAIEHALIPASEARNMSVIVYSALLHGILTGAYKTGDEVPEGRARTRHFSSTRESVRHSEAGHEELTFAALDAFRKIAKQYKTSVRELAISWVLSHKSVATVLAGSRTVAQAESNAAAGSAVLPQEAITAATQASGALKEAMGPNPDMWQTTSRVKW